MQVERRNRTAAYALSRSRYGLAVSTPDEGRALFIDESGHSEECFHLTAVSVHAAAIERAESVLADYYLRFTSFFGLPEDYELHGSVLVRKRGAPTDDDYLALHQREFLYRDALKSAADIETVRVYSVSWEWAPHPRNPEDHGRGPNWRERETYHLLYEWVSELQEPIVEVTVDGTANHTATRSYESYVRKARRNGNRLFLPDTPILIDSRSSRLVQFADLIAYAGYQALQHKSAVREREAMLQRGGTATTAGQEKFSWTELLHDFYNQVVPQISAAGGWHFAMRTYDGAMSPKPTHGPESH